MAEQKTATQTPSDQIKTAVSNASTSVDSKQIEKAANNASTAITNALETNAGKIAGQIEGGIKSLSQKVDNFEQELNAVTVEGLVDRGVESLQNMAVDLAAQAVTQFASKFGASVQIQFSEPDSNGFIYPIDASLDATGGVSGTVASLIKLITGLAGFNSLEEAAAAVKNGTALDTLQSSAIAAQADFGGTLQRVVTDATVEGINSIGSQIEGKIGAFTDNVIKEITGTITNKLADAVESSLSGVTDLNRVTKYISSVDSDGSGNLVLTKSEITSTGPTVSDEISQALSGLRSDVATDMETLISPDKVLKIDTEKAKNDLQNITGGKDPEKLVEALNKSSEYRTQYTRVTEEVQSKIRTRIAKNGGVGIVQSLSVEVLTDIKSNVEKFAPKLSEKDVQRVIELSQGDLNNQDEAITLLLQSTGKDYNSVKNFLKSIDTTITSATRPVPNDVIFSEPYVIGSFSKEWKKGRGNPTFPYVNSLEELQAEFRNIDREVTELVVHWTETPTNKNIGSEEINQNHLAAGLDGIGYHYVIRRDGSLQRGRPVNIEGQHADVNSHNSRSIGVVFVGGINTPSETTNIENDIEKFLSVQSLTRSQFNTFDHMCRSFYTVFAGGQILGHMDLDTNEYDPGFDVREYALANFGKESFYDVEGKDPKDHPPYTVDEINKDELFRLLG